MVLDLTLGERHQAPAAPSRQLNFVDQLWTFAKTLPPIPYEYTLKKNNQLDEFDPAVVFIREGEARPWGSQRTRGVRLQASNEESRPQVVTSCGPPSDHFSPPPRHRSLRPDHRLGARPMSYMPIPVLELKSEKVIRPRRGRPPGNLYRTVRRGYSLASESD